MRRMARERLRLLAFLRLGLGLFGNVPGAVERALHPIVFRGLASRSRRQRRGRGLCSDGLSCHGFGRGRWCFVRLLAQIDKRHAGDEDKNNETTHSLFCSNWRAIRLQKATSIAHSRTTMGEGTVTTDSVQRIGYGHLVKEGNRAAL